MHTKHIRLRVVVTADASPNGLTCNGFAGVMDDILLVATAGQSAMDTLIANYQTPLWEAEAASVDTALLTWLTFDSPLSHLWQPPVVTGRAPQLFNDPTAVKVRLYR